MTSQECLPIRKFWCIFCKYFNPAFKKLSRPGSFCTFLQLLYSRVKKKPKRRSFKESKLPFIFSIKILFHLANKIGNNKWKLSGSAKPTHKLHADTFKAEITK